MRLNIDWQWPTGSLVELDRSDLQAMQAAGIDVNDLDAVGNHVQAQLKDPEHRKLWLRRIEDDWTDRSEGDFDVINIAVEDSR
ncbi:hypothetical protein ACFFKU_06945 [Kineococcus gynurae]|uniref:Uncharacterized protein n=1 Tax=Kineococcus gynurae TaxID=452979 RepID=A0ABV5LWY5_9ACTN